MRKVEQREIETEIYINTFDVMINELLHPINDCEAKDCLDIFQYYLINIVPQYKGFIKEFIENETEYYCYRPFHQFLFYMGRLAVYVEIKEYREAFGCIEHLYARAYGKDTFFQPKYVYNIIKILSRIGGKTTMLQRKQDEMTFKEMVELVNERSSEFKYIKRKINKLPAEKEAFKDAQFQKFILNRKQEEQFRESMHCINNMMIFTKSEQYKNRCDKGILIDYLMDIIKNDLKYDCFANVIYRKEQLYLYMKFPNKYYDSDGNECHIKVKEKAVEVDFSKTVTFSIPWCQRRISDNLVKFATEKFKYFEGNHQSVYFPQLDMCFAYNGNHTIAMGVKNNEGKIMSDVVDLEPLFGNVDTDGVYWFSAYDKDKKLGELEDFRLGLLFKLAEMKYNIEKGKDKE